MTKKTTTPLDEAMATMNVGAFMKVGTGPMARPRTLFDFNQWEDVEEDDETAEFPTLRTGVWSGHGAPIREGEGELSTEEKLVLGATFSFKSKHMGRDRRQMLNLDHLGGEEESGMSKATWDRTVAGLVAKKLLRKNKAISPAGKKALQAAGGSGALTKIGRGYKYEDKAQRAKLEAMGVEIVAEQHNGYFDPMAEAEARMQTVTIPAAGQKVERWLKQISELERKLIGYGGFSGSQVQRGIKQSKLMKNLELVGRKSHRIKIPSPSAKVPKDIPGLFRAVATTLRTMGDAMVKLTKAQGSPAGVVAGQQHRANYYRTVADTANAAATTTAGVIASQPSPEQAASRQKATRALLGKLLGKKFEAGENRLGASVLREGKKPPASAAVLRETFEKPGLKV